MKKRRDPPYTVLVTKTLWNPTKSLEILLKFCADFATIILCPIFRPNVNKLSHQAVNWLQLLLLALAGTACQLSLPVSWWSEKNCPVDEVPLELPARCVGVCVHCSTILWEVPLKDWEELELFSLHPAIGPGALPWLRRGGWLCRRKLLPFVETGCSNSGELRGELSFPALTTSLPVVHGNKQNVYILTLYNSVRLFSGIFIL